MGWVASRRSSKTTERAVATDGLGVPMMPDIMFVEDTEYGSESVSEGVVRMADLAHGRRECTGALG